MNNTAEELETTLTLLADEYKRAPVAVGATVIDYNLVMALYLLMTKYPNDVPNAMRQIKSLLDGHDLAAVAEYFSKISGAIDQGGEGLIGIKCSDAYPRTDEFTDIIPAVEYVRETSTLFADTMTGITMECAQWPFEAKERYSGHFNVKTPNPVLFIGNTYDAATPVASARNMSATFDGSVVVERDGFGVSFTPFPAMDPLFTPFYPNLHILTNFNKISTGHFLNPLLVSRESYRHTFLMVHCRRMAPFAKSTTRFSMRRYLVN